MRITMIKDKNVKIKRNIMEINAETYINEFFGKSKIKDKNETIKGLNINRKVDLRRA